MQYNPCILCASLYSKLSWVYGVLCNIHYLYLMYSFHFIKSNRFKTVITTAYPVDCNHMNWVCLERISILHVHITVTVYPRNFVHGCAFCHYTDVIMSTMASQITSLTIVYSTVYSGADQRKHQSSASLAFVRGIHR